MRSTNRMLAGICCCVTAMSMAVTGVAGEKRELTDSELDTVTAGTGGGEAPQRLFAFEATRKTQSGNTVSAAGDLLLLESAGGVNVGTLTLADDAQRNLRSLVNINAVNSPVNVLLNLNLTIDSSVGSVNQLNLNDVAPDISLPPVN